MDYDDKTKPTNASATPRFRDITVRDVAVTAADAAIMCDGLPEAPVTGPSSTTTILGSFKVPPNLG